MSLPYDKTNPKHLQAAKDGRVFSGRLYPNVAAAKAAQKAGQPTQGAPQGGPPPPSLQAGRGGAGGGRGRGGGWQPTRRGGLMMGGPGRGGGGQLPGGPLPSRRMRETVIKKVPLVVGEKDVFEVEASPADDAIRTITEQFVDVRIEEVLVSFFWLGDSPTYTGRVIVAFSSMAVVTESVDADNFLELAPPYGEFRAVVVGKPAPCRPSISFCKALNVVDMAKDLSGPLRITLLPALTAPAVFGGVEGDVVGMATVAISLSVGAQKPKIHSSLAARRPVLAAPIPRAPVALETVRLDPYTAVRPRVQRTGSSHSHKASASDQYID